MGLCLGAACKLSFWSGRLGKMPASSQAPEKALKLIVSVSSLLRARPSIDRRNVVVFPRTMSNAGYGHGAWGITWLFAPRVRS